MVVGKVMGDEQWVAVRVSDMDVGRAQVQGPHRFVRVSARREQVVVPVDPQTDEGDENSEVGSEARCLSVPSRGCLHTRTRTPTSEEA